MLRELRKLFEFLFFKVKKVVIRYKMPCKDLLYIKIWCVLVI